MDLQCTVPWGRDLDDYIWRTILSPEELERRRMRAMRLFLHEYGEGRLAGRYINASLPALPFQDNAFDYGLCSHLFFLYSPQLDEQVHINGVLELCRVAREVRIYPLVSIEDNERSRYLPAVLSAVLSALTEEGYCYEEKYPLNMNFGAEPQRC